VKTAAYQEIRRDELRPGDVILPWGLETEVTGTWTVQEIDLIPLSPFMNVITDRGPSKAPRSEPVRIVPRGGEAL
jgi:hypothetical protein